jgi:hypothetical protein
MSGCLWLIKRRRSIREAQKHADPADPDPVLDLDPQHRQTESSNIYISNNSRKIYKGTRKAGKDV